MRRFLSRPLLAFYLALLFVSVLGIGATGAFADHVPAGTYVNPLQIDVPGAAYDVETFADPAVIRGQDGLYYAYATTDPLSNADRNAGGSYNFQRIPTARSADMVHWTYVGNAFSTVPSWGEPNAGIWAPEVRYMNGQYYMYYGVTDVKPEVSGAPAGCGNDNAIGVATSPSPTGPWTASGQPVVYPRPNGPPANCNFFWTYDPAVIQDDAGQKYIYYGSYYGGIFARKLSADGLTSDPATETQVTIANRYEGAYVVRRDGFYYLFVSATDCCRGPLTGYSVFAGRSASPMGPFIDRLGVPLTDGRVGGSVVISMNGNKWVGPGHNSVIQDQAGQDWFFYHAINRFDPYLDTDPADPADPDPFNINKRPMLMDRLSWIEGWPMVRSGHWASDTPQPAPVTTAGGTAQPTLAPKQMDVPGALQDGPSDEFNGALEPQWSWVRPPSTATYSLTENPGFFRFRTQRADLYEGNNSASVLIQNAPTGDFMVETKFQFNLPPEGCCFNFQQAGVVLYENDDRYLKNAHVSIWETRQTEWAKEVAATDPDRARNNTYGNTVIGPPGDPNDAVLTTTTWLRIVKRTDAGGQQHYTGYSSFDGVRWERGGTWTHNLSNIKIGLVSMGRGGPASDPNDVRIADFDYVRVYSVAPLATATATVTQTRTVVPTATSTVCPITFRDVPPTNTFYPFIRCLACRGIVSGYADGTFRPNAEITRGQIAKMVSNAAGFSEDPGGQIFQDVPPGSTFYPYINRLARRNVMGGYSCALPPSPGCQPGNRPYFLPNANATRGQLAKIVSNAADYTEDPGPRIYEDVPVENPFYDYINRLTRRNVMGGYQCGTAQAGGPCVDPERRPYFRPFNNVTRGQAAKIVANTFYPNCAAQTPLQQ